MLKLNISSFSEGLSSEKRTVLPSEIDLDEQEFYHPINLVFNINKIGSEVFLKVQLDTSVALVCDRCLADYKYKLNETVSIVCTTDNSLVTKDEDGIYFISETTNEINITDSIRDALILNIPQKKLCSEKCKGLCAQCGVNLNDETCNCKSEKIDPRWEALKKIKFN
ncbi:DUF177 domain-containing protein [candidate division KSB1 bacterium]|nr:DUF177 domain-containing protein [candidate division KSB1 bacterium]